MKAISAKATAGCNLGTQMMAADNSGAKIVKIVSVKRGKGKKGKQRTENHVLISPFVYLGMVKCLNCSLLIVSISYFISLVLCLVSCI